MKSVLRTSLTLAFIGALAVLAAAAGLSVSRPDALATDLKVLLPDGAPQLTANVRVGDLLGDGSGQIFATEPLRSQVMWVKVDGEAVAFTDGLVQPVRTHVVDIDGDEDRDLLVADIGQLFPTDDRVGRLVLFRNDGSLNFETVVLLDDVGRVVCAEAADLDGDGDQDIAVCVFGHVVEGKVIWLEQKEGFTFEEHLLDPRPGAIHAFPFDADADGDLDIAVSLSQLSEEILLFRNGGGGEFTEEVLFKATTEDYGMSGIELSDLDQDGDTDILFTNGDEGDKIVEVDPYEFHGLSWLENDGLGQFTVHEVVRQWGAYAVRAADIDDDGDLDLVLANHQVDEWHLDTEVQRLIWLENDGAQDFTGHKVRDPPPLMLTIDVMFANGGPTIVGGSFNRSSLTDREFGEIGHRLVTFTIRPGRLAQPGPPSVGGPDIAGLVRTVTIAGVGAVIVGLVLIVGPGLSRRRGWPVILLIAASLATGCGDDSEKTAATPTLTSPPTTTVAATATPAPAPVRPLSPSEAAGPGKIAFWSTRDGNAEIYAMNADGSNVTRLTFHDNIDTVPDWSPDGRRIVFTSNRVANMEIYVMDADGTNVKRLTTDPALDTLPDWSPDGSKIAFVSSRDGFPQIYTMDSDGSNQSRMTDNFRDNWSPAWSPDGTKIAFISGERADTDVYVMDADGSNVIRLTEDADFDEDPAWSPDGRKIAFKSGPAGAVDTNIYLMDADGSNVIPLTTHPSLDLFHAWSPDGSKIIFTSLRDGNLELYVIGADGSNVTRLTDHTAKDGTPDWSIGSVP